MAIFVETTKGYDLFLLGFGAGDYKPLLFNQKKYLQRQIPKGIIVTMNLKPLARRCGFYDYSSESFFFPTIFMLVNSKYLHNFCSKSLWKWATYSAKDGKKTFILCFFCTLFWQKLKLSRVGRNKDQRSLEKSKYTTGFN